MKRSARAGHRPRIAAFASCDLPRPPPAPSGAVSSQQARPRPSSTEVKVADFSERPAACAAPARHRWRQHCYCTCPACPPTSTLFHLPAPAPERIAHAQRLGGRLPAGGRKVPTQRGWRLARTRSSNSPGLARRSILHDQRPATLRSDRRVQSQDVAKIHPKPTRPMCWVARSPADLFHAIMGGEDFSAHRRAGRAAARLLRVPAPIRRGQRHTLRGALRIQDTRSRSRSDVGPRRSASRSLTARMPLRLLGPGGLRTAAGRRCCRRFATWRVIILVRDAPGLRGLRLRRRRPRPPRGLACARVAALVVGYRNTSVPPHS